MNEANELTYAVWYSRGTDRIYITVESDSFDIRDAVFLRHQLDRAISDYEGHVGR